MFSATVAAVTIQLLTGHVRSQDKNGDGRPDIQEYYQRVALVRRESDRNFNGQTDLVEDFDSETHSPSRSLTDLDFDGAADLLVLYRDGRPVFSERARSLERATDPATSPATFRGDSRRLVDLSDPFASELALRATRVTPGVDGWIGVSTSGALPCPRAIASGRLSPSARVIRLFAN